MRTLETLVFLGTLAFAANAGAQEFVAPGITANFDDEIVVTGDRLERELPLAYESELAVDPLTRTIERDMFGRTRFIYTRQFGPFEYRKVVHDGRGRGDFIHDYESPDFRFALHW
ncbi:MAG: hypothetical protein WBK28_01250 [Minisyncoccia bacterium]